MNFFYSFFSRKIIISAEENKALVRRWLDAWNVGNDEEAANFHAADGVLHNPMPPPEEIRGLADIKQLIAAYRQAFPEGQVIIEDMIAEGDKVAIRFTFRGVHKGEMLGIAPTNKEIAPTGKKVIIKGISISRIVDGKGVEEWENFDTYGFMQQLGAVPPLGEGDNEQQIIR